MQFPVMLSLAVLSCSLIAAAAGQKAPHCPAVPAGEKAPWLNPAYSAECRAQFVLGALPTLDDKFAFLSSGRMQPGSNQRNVMAELGLTRGGSSDGPAGLRVNNTATSFPTPLTIAATFDQHAAAEFGDLLGKEFFTAGMSTVVGPAMDIARTWHFGRVTESMGEDPFLTASIVVPEIQAIQANHVAATMKHFLVYSEEQNRIGDKPTGVGPGLNEEISERAQREIYFPAFRDAVTKAGVAEAMCAFASVNHEYSCENTYALNVLKEEWGFEGTVGPDSHDAQRTIVRAFLAGLDRGTMVPPKPGGNASYFPDTKSLRQAVDDGEVPVSRIDDLILRRLVVPFRIGIFDHPAQKVSGEVSTPEHRAAAADLVTSGAVLLKNNGGILPFGPQVKSVAIIGTQATDQAVVGERGSVYVTPSHLVPVLDAVKQRAGDAVQIFFAPGTLGLQHLPALSGNSLRTPNGAPGVKAEYFANPNRDFSGKPFATRTEPSISIEKTPEIEGLPTNLKWSVRYATLFTPDRSGTQRFTLSGCGEGRLIVGGKLVDEFMRADFQQVAYGNVLMTAGKPVEIRVEYTPREASGNQIIVKPDATFGINLSLGWAEPDNKIAEAAETARKADVAVVFVGQLLGEGMDRLHLNLQNDQDELIEAVAKANPHTVVVLNTGGAVLMPWLDKVSAVLETWLPGDAVGPATAKLLFGDADPGGRLPVTFPADETQGPATRQSEYPGTLAADGSLDTAHFDEGIFVGYRYWDQYGQKPLFPFGYGLSYTSFTFSGESVKPLPDGGADVEVKVKNIGKRPGSEVVQVYVEFPAPVGEPPRQLKGFQKVALVPGEEKTIHVALDKAAFMYWDEGSNAWKIAPGEYQVIAGRSSRDTAWKAVLTP